MQYTPVSRRTREPGRDPRVYADLDALVRLQFEARGFSFLPRQPVHSVLHGRHASRLRGRGLNFEELRNYVPGDDIRTVDWKATARTREPQVRVYSEERDRPVWLIVNQRQSMFFGSRVRMKSVTAAEIAALAAWRVLDAGDRVGAMVFNDQDIITIKPQRSRHSVMRILGAVVKMGHDLSASDGNAPNPGMLNQVLRLLRPQVPHDCLICLVGDGSGVDAQTIEQATALTAHNDLLFALVYDPAEAELPAVGRLAATDGQSYLSLDTSDPRFVSGLARDFNQGLEAIQQLSRRYTVPLFTLRTDRPVPEQVREQLGASGVAGRI